MFSFISRIPYQNLTLFVIGTLAGVFIGFFITERYWISDGVERNIAKFNCLVDYLRNNSITDDYFHTEQRVFSDEALKDCTVILKQFSKLEDVGNNLYSSYNTSQNLCKALQADKMKKLCLSENDVEGSKNQSEDNRTCIDVNEYLKIDKISKYETSESLYEHTRHNCDDAQSCFNCIREILIENDSYMLTRLHAKAVHYTYINYEVWRYFQISKKVNELLSVTSVVENEAFMKCNMDQKCSNSSSVAAESNE